MKYKKVKSVTSLMNDSYILIFLLQPSFNAPELILFKDQLVLTFKPMVEKRKTNGEKKLAKKL